MIVDLRTLDILRWIDEPPLGIAWENNGPHRPAIHPDDVPVARQMSRQLTDDRVKGTLKGSGRSAATGWPWVWLNLWTKVKITGLPSCRTAWPMPASHVAQEVR